MATPPTAPLSPRSSWGSGRRTPPRSPTRPTLTVVRTTRPRPSPLASSARPRTSRSAARTSPSARCLPTCSSSMRTVGIYQVRTWRTARRYRREIARDGGLQWKALEDTAKDVFIEKSITLKEEYAAAMGTWRTEHPEEAAAKKTEKKEPKEKKAKKAKVPAKPVNLDDAPEAPPWDARVRLRHLSIVKNSDGKSQFKEFAEAVSAVAEPATTAGLDYLRAGGRCARHHALGQAPMVRARSCKHLKTKFVSDEARGDRGVTTRRRGDQGDQGDHS